MSTEQGAQRRPFHETIVDAIRRASANEFSCLAGLIRETKIPKGHDEIIAAWKQRLQEAGWPYDYDFGGVLADLLAQKEEAAAEEKAKEQTAAAS